MKRKLLLAGGGHADIPMILAAQELGFHVISSGNDRGGLGHSYADETHFADYSDEQAMLDIAKNCAVDAICASCNDFSQLSAAWVAEQLGLPGYDSYETNVLLHHKDRFRAFALAQELPSPKGHGFGSVQEAVAGLGGFTYPLIVKPVDMTGGKGISTIREPGALTAMLGQALATSRARRIIVEEFIEGTQHGLSTFVVDGKIAFHFRDDEHYHLNPYLVSGASVPSRESSAHVDSLLASLERLVALLGLGTGLLHVQYVLRGGAPYILEVCRRPPGDLYVALVRHATGVAYPAYIVKAAAGLDCSDMQHVSPEGFWIRHCVMADRSGRVRGVEFDSFIKSNVVDKMMWWTPGDEVEDPLLYKSGIVFLRFASAEEMAEKASQMQELIRVVVE